jgi:hypothetical protein
MPSWNELLTELESLPNDQAKNQWLQTRPLECLREVSSKRGDRNVIFYASAFLQKPQLPGMNTQLTPEEINGFMSVMHGMNWQRGLSLILHTPGGITNAAETIVSYLHSKFGDIEVIVPTFAMSAGTMIALGANRIIMGRQSQLGPIDPQMPMPDGRTVSARAIVDQFDRAKKEIQGDLKLAHLWAPILQSLGPGLLQEAQNALGYGEAMVAGWLEKHMFSGRSDASTLAATVASYFNKADLHKSHGRRIPRDEARDQGVIVEDLENDQSLQESVLTAYHLITIVFEKSPATKILFSNTGRVWVKNANQIAFPIPMPIQVPGPIPRPVQRPGQIPSP